MKCKDVEFGTSKCAYFIHVPFGNRSCKNIDKCMLPEVLDLWEKGIRTTGCCCGHGRREPFIGVYFDDIEKMKSLGYKVQFNPVRPRDEDSFYPKTVISRTETF